MDHYETAQVLIAHAGTRLRQHLEADPRNIDGLSALDLAIVKLTQGASFIDRTANRASQQDREEREAERASRPADRIERRSFSMEEYAARPASKDDDEREVVDVLD